MSYREFSPHPALAAQVRVIWIYESSAADGTDEFQSIVPDGYPELLLHYGDRFSEIGTDGKLHQQPRLMFAGQISRPLMLRSGASVGVIGIRFWPHAARALLQIPMSELVDHRLDLATLWNNIAEPLLDEVWSAPNNVERVRVVENFLLRRLKNSVIAPPDAALARCVDLLDSVDGKISVDALASAVNLSTRQIQRRFLHEIGIPPRLLASIFRFRRVFDLVEQSIDTHAPWTDAALSAGYFDQAHMIRDFKRFAGQTPQAFRLGLQNNAQTLSLAMLAGEKA
jgi:AraC-like DNA-binding protein